MLTSISRFLQKQVHPEILFFQDFSANFFVWNPKVSIQFYNILCFSNKAVIIAHFESFWILAVWDKYPKGPSRFRPFLIIRPFRNIIKIKFHSLLKPWFSLFSWSKRIFILLFGKIFYFFLNCWPEIINLFFKRRDKSYVDTY
jgi:hypothetical protein